jgi:metal-responsive CopG/Arc/MetJ family transcriptional regulator
MSTKRESVRQSVSLPLHLANQVRALARAGSASANRVIVDLIQAGLEAKEREKQEFLALADRLAESQDATEQAELKAELARRTFGD